MYNFLKKNPQNTVLNPERYTPEEAEELFCDVTAQVKCVMSVVNNAAYTTMMEAIDNIKKTPYYKGVIKNCINKALKAHEDHERDLKWGNYHGIEFFEPRKLSPEEIEGGAKPATKEMVFDWYLDIGACAYKRSIKELEMLRWQVLQALTKDGINHRAELSYVCVANAIIEYSCSVFDQLMNDFKKRTHIDFYKVFVPFRLTSVFKNFDCAARLIGKAACPIDKEVNLNDSDNIRIAFRAFENAIMNDLNTYQSADEAITMNKDMLSPEVYKAYREKYDKALEHHNNKKQ